MIQASALRYGLPILAVVVAAGLPTTAWAADAGSPNAVPAMATESIETIACEADARIAKNSEVRMKVLPRGPAANILDAPARRLYRKTFGPFDEDSYGFSSVEILARRVPVETSSPPCMASQDELRLFARFYGRKGERWTELIRPARERMIDYNPETASGSSLFAEIEQLKSPQGKLWVSVR